MTGEKAENAAEWQCVGKETDQSIPPDLQCAADSTALERTSARIASISFRNSRGYSLLRRPAGQILQCEGHDFGVDLETGIDRDDLRADSITNIHGEDTVFEASR
jgi:hypothetical protein